MPTYGPQGHLLGLWKENGKVTILIDADGCPVVDLTIGNTAQFPPGGLSTAPAPVAGENIRALGTALAPRRTVGNMLAKNAANQK